MASRAGWDKLVLRGLRFHGYHGVFKEERKLGQKFVVDVDAWLDLSRAGETDSLEHSVSYAELYRYSPLGCVSAPAANLMNSCSDKFPLVQCQPCESSGGRSPPSSARVGGKQYCPEDV